MPRYTTLVLSLLVLASGGAQAATLITTPFTPITVPFNINGQTNLPWTDPHGNQFSGSGQVIDVSPNNISQMFWYPGTPVTITFANPVDRFGFSVDDVSFALGSFVSATLSNGDSYSTGFAFTRNTFWGLSSATPFSSVTINYDSGGGSPTFSDFRFTNSGIPEPGTLGLIAPAVLALGIRLWGRRARRDSRRS